MAGELKTDWRKRQLRSPQLDRRRVFEIQVSLRAVKTCAGCGEQRPIEMFDTGDRGIADDCEVCRHERSRHTFRTNMKQGWEKAQPQIKARRERRKARRKAHLRESWP